MGKLFYNIHAQGVHDRPQFLSDLADAKPAWALVMDDLDFTKACKQASPTTNVIYRRWPDDDPGNLGSPDKWLAEMRRDIGDADLWLYAGNEWGAEDRVFTWIEGLLDALDKLGSRAPKVVFLNFATGTPEPDMWKNPRLKRIVERIAEKPDKRVLGLHEYAGIVFSNMLQDTPGAPLNLDMSTWPKKLDYKKNDWLLGRYRFIGAVPGLRIVLTEFGLDDIAATKDWAKSHFPMTPPYQNLKGIRSLENAYRIIFPGVPLDVAFVRQIRYAIEVIYAGTAVEGLLLFAYGARNEWSGFEVQGLEAVHAFVKGVTEAVQTAPPPTTKPPIIPGWRTGKSNRNFSVNIRQMPSTAAPIEGKIAPGDTFLFTDDPDNPQWMVVLHGDIVGFVRADVLPI